MNSIDLNKRSLLCYDNTTDNNNRQGVKTMKRANDDIRAAARAAGVFLWQVAAALGYTDTHFCRIMRKEFSAEKKARIFEIIRVLEKENREQEAI